jgi:hypothetical protein
LNTDVIHEFGSQEDWNESFYFNFYDRGQDICGFMRIGLKPNKKEKDVFCYLMMPSGHIYGLMGNAPMENNDLDVLGLKFTMVENEKAWKLSFDGELLDFHKEGEKEKVHFELDWITLNPVFDYHESVGSEKEKAAQAVASEHLEQYGKASGRITLGNRVYDLTAMGERDHSWGVREWGAALKWLWMTAQFDEDLALNITKVWIDERTVIDAGFIHEEGKNRPIVRVDLVIEETERGSPAYVYMAVYDKDGEVLGVKAKVERCAQLAFPGKDGKVVAKMHECLSRFTVSDGDDVGFGIVEYLHRRR